MELKVCSVCGVEKELDLFNPKKRGSDEKSSMCKECNSKKCKEYYEKNKEKVKAKTSAYFAENKERMLEKQRERWKKHYPENKERILAYHEKYREENRDICKERIKRWMATSHGKMVCRIKEEHRRGRKKSTDDGTVTKVAIEQMIETQNNECKICNCDLRIAGFHIDHIYPLSKGGPHSITNIQILCPTCNYKKSNKITT